ncbi:MAG: caspase family protein [Rectinemataceae bacterium]
MKGSPARFLAFLLAFIIPVILAAASDIQRFALVIGNNSYTGIGDLRNPANDAEDIAAALVRIGFTVELLKDADLPAMEEGVIKLGNRLGGSSDAIGFFFFAGHGVQSGGINYLIPSDTSIAAEAFLKSKALSAQSVMDILGGARNRLNIVVLDACRDNPFTWGRSAGGRGLSVAGSQPSGSIVAYATSAGSIAQDGQGRNGVFTGELLKNLETPGLEIAEVFKRTGAGVSRVSAGRQIPAVYNQFFGDALLAGPAPVVAAAAPVGAAAPTGTAALAGAAAPSLYRQRQLKRLPWPHLSRQYRTNPRHCRQLLPCLREWIRECPLSRLS